MSKILAMASCSPLSTPPPTQTGTRPISTMLAVCIGSCTARWGTVPTPKISPLRSFERLSVRCG